MLSQDILIPALAGLGLYAQTNGINLANNTSILLMLFVLLRDSSVGLSAAEAARIAREREILNGERFFRGCF